MRSARPRRRLALRVGMPVALTPLVLACASIPADALRLSESALQIRSLQTRTYAAPDEATILSASIALLQDMEYNLDEVERPLGVLTASKIIDADSPTEMAALLLVDLICAAGGTSCGSLATASDEERIIVTLVVLPSLARGGHYTARITLQRILFDREGRVKEMAVIGDARTYQQIFAELSRSLALEMMP